MQPGEYKSHWDEIMPALMAWLHEQRRMMEDVYLEGEVANMGKRFTVVPHYPIIGGQQPLPEATEGGGELVAVPLEGLAEKVAEFTSLVQTGLSADWCKCVWVLHPADNHVEEGQCRECFQPQDAKAHQKVDAYSDDEAFVDAHPFRGRRKRKVQEHPLCPSHTAGGLILGFLQWIHPEDERLVIPDMLLETPDDDQIQS